MNKNTEPTGKQSRQAAILEAVGEGDMSTQNDLVKALKKKGISATQVSISRDVAELGLVKAGGVYKTAPAPGAAADPELPLKAFVKKVEAAGPNLTVIRCEVGTAPRVGLVLDGLTLQGLVGTLAGDDTVFVACASPAAQKKLIEYLKGRTPQS